MKDNTIKILGCRGSVPVSGKEYEKYGGATTCFVLKIDGQLLVIDAGTGVLNLGKCLDGEKEIPMIFSHAHVDHIMGFPMCPLALDAEMSFKIYSEHEDILSYIMTQPIWPITREMLPSKVENVKLTDVVNIGSLSIHSMDGVHNGNVKIFRISGKDKSVVVMTDCTITEETRKAFLEFAKDCDLLLIDGQYSEEEWHGRENFGHNSYVYASAFAKECGAKNVRIVHHSPDKTDEQIDAMQKNLNDIGYKYSFTYEGEEIDL
ncbi:MAG: MBL fold metallo-hydrolase [Clostridia bacterium]|nr:MBL fold metallo-hydrolase [Clostridia bacterium]